MNGSYAVVFIDVGVIHKLYPDAVVSSVMMAS